MSTVSFKNSSLIYRIIRVLLFVKYVLLNGKFSCCSLSGNEISENEKFLYVSEILRKAIELSAPEIHIEYEEIKHSNMSSNSSISESTDEAESTADELPIEKVLIFNKISFELIFFSLVNLKLKRNTRFSSGTFVTVIFSTDNSVGNPAF